jgi:hypothetical protein
MHLVVLLDIPELKQRSKTMLGREELPSGTRCSPELAQAGGMFALEIVIFL